MSYNPNGYDYFGAPPGYQLQQQMQYQPQPFRGRNQPAVVNINMMMPPPIPYANMFYQPPMQYSVNMSNFTPAFDGRRSVVPISQAYPDYDDPRASVRSNMYEYNSDYRRSILPSYNGPRRDDRRSRVEMPPSDEDRMSVRSNYNYHGSRRSGRQSRSRAEIEVITIDDEDVEMPADEDDDCQIIFEHIPERSPPPCYSSVCPRNNVAAAVRPPSHPKPRSVHERRPPPM